jgi:hypothetical protein
MWPFTRTFYMDKWMHTWPELQLGICIPASELLRQLRLEMQRLPVIVNAILRESYETEM